MDPHDTLINSPNYWKDVLWGYRPRYSGLNSYEKPKRTNKHNGKFTKKYADGRQKKGKRK